MRNVVLEVRRTMNGWILEFPGGEEVVADDSQAGPTWTSTISTDVQYGWGIEDGQLVIRLRDPNAAYLREGTE